MTDNVRPLKKGVGWELDGAYNPDRRYTIASDRQGHGVPRTVMFPTEVSGEMAELIQAGYIPEYRSAQDLIRDAVVHHLHRLNEGIKSKKIERTINLTVLYDDSARRRLDREQYQDFINIVTENLHWLARGLQHQEAKKYLIELLGKVDGIPELHRKEFKEFIKEQLRELAEKA